MEVESSSSGRDSPDGAPADTGNHAPTPVPLIASPVAAGDTTSTGMGDTQAHIANLSSPDSGNIPGDSENVASQATVNTPGDTPENISSRDTVNELVDTTGNISSRDTVNKPGDTTGNILSRDTVNELVDTTGNISSRDTVNEPDDTTGNISSRDTVNEPGDTTGNIASGDAGKTVVNTTEGQQGSDKDHTTVKHGETDGGGDTKLLKDGPTANGDIVTLDKDVQDLLSKDGLTSDERNKLFGKAVFIDQAGQKNEALKCYLKCLVGLREDSKFTLLPQCLRNIADIYYGKDEFEKAISFIQAEKLYYENVLIDNTELQRQMDETAPGEDEQGELNMNALRATEFEHLAKLCLDEKQPQLALEYAGKATKLRQELYGDDHPLVKESLDFFTTIYAEVGKHQYSESLMKYDTAEPVDPLAEGQEGNVTLDSSGEPVSILRKRKNTEGEKGEEKKHVRFDDSHASLDGVSQSEENCVRAVLLVLLLVCVFILAVLCLYVYCRQYPSDWCRDFKQDVHYAVMRVRYWYYQYFSNTDSVKSV